MDHPDADGTATDARVEALHRSAANVVRGDDAGEAGLQT
jgi:hypothetical protein